MKVFIGSVIILLLISAGIWLILSPSFKKIGDTANKVKKSLKEEKDGEPNAKNEKQ